MPAAPPDAVAHSPTGSAAGDLAPPLLLAHAARDASAFRIGGPSARVRAALWEEVRRYDGMARALLTYNTNNKQGFAFETHATSGTRLIMKVSR